MTEHNATPTTNAPVDAPRIIATYQPQAIVDDQTVDVDGAFTFDATVPVLLLAAEQGWSWVYDTLTDRTGANEDRLWDPADHPDHTHTGPYVILAEAAIAAYFEWRFAHPEQAAVYEQGILDANDSPFDADGQYTGDFLYDDMEDCDAAGAHLTSVDDDGYETYETTFTFRATDEEQAATLIAALQDAMATSDAIPVYPGHQFTTPRPRATWPENDTERSAYADWQYLVSNGDTTASFRDWFATRND